MLRSKRLNYNEIIKKIDSLWTKSNNTRLLIISSDKKEEDGLYHLTQSNGKGSKMMTFESLEDVERFIKGQIEKYTCHIIRVGKLED